MAIGIRYSNVYFLDPPTPVQVVAGMQALTGLSMGQEVLADDYLELFHPEMPAWRIELGWSTDRLGRLQRLREAAPEYCPPFPDYPHSISLYLDPRVAPRRYQYLEISLLVVLQELGGQWERPLQLPRWAGTKWADMPPLGRWEAIKDRWK